MSAILPFLMAFLAVWMGLSALCGYRQWWAGFGVLMFAGLGANTVWMIVWLQASFREPHVYIALGSAALYGVGALGIGWFAGRFVRVWRASAVDSSGV